MSATQHVGRSMADVLRALRKLGPYTTTLLPAEEVDPAAVRQWATAAGIDVASRGPIPAAVVDMYRNREDSG